ncbi:MAG: type II toxin-antitoxin system PemK/MazF family toxin [Defluviitaleaceae bacterium]|nr:type II toxin-antitoxin system PemK/MazF family toxin [Defluviitaleaceae bacterium]
MGRFVKGDIAVLNFPFSDLSGAKRRPALVLADLTGNDVLLCQITSIASKDAYAVRIETGDYVRGMLKTESVIRPNKVFTADKSLVLYVACTIGNEKVNKTTETLMSILNG